MPAKKGLTLETLIGISKVKCKRMSVAMGNRKGTEEQLPILVVEVMEGEQEGQQAKYGIITEVALNGILKEAYEEDGDIFVMLPTPEEVGLDKINWVNVV